MIELDNRIWALQEAAKPFGFTPHANGTAEYLESLERHRLVRQSNVDPVWYITEEGRAELVKLEAQRCDLKGTE